jgi:hypothetical protein
MNLRDFARLISPPASISDSYLVNEFTTEASRGVRGFLVGFRASPRTAYLEFGGPFEYDIPVKFFFIF